MFPQLTTEVQAGEVLVEMNTTLGAIKIKLFPEQAPKTVENFLGHAKSATITVSFSTVLSKTS